MYVEDSFSNRIDPLTSNDMSSYILVVGAIARYGDLEAIQYFDTRYVIRHTFLGERLLSTKENKYVISIVISFPEDMILTLPLPHGTSNLTKNDKKELAKLSKSSRNDCKAVLRFTDYLCKEYGYINDPYFQSHIYNKLVNIINGTVA